MFTTEDKKRGQEEGFQGTQLSITKFRHVDADDFLFGFFLKTEGKDFIWFYGYPC